MTLADNKIKLEDTLQCYFFSTTTLCTAEWEELCESINEIITSVAKDYIWHRDEFRVVLPLNVETNDIPSHLVSTTCFGDNIEDEWFIVYLIFEITKIYNHLIIQMEDNDGDFLLIEAAEYLPAWASPETTVNRVFMFNQHLHLIPHSIASTDLPLTLVDALNLIKQKPEITKASKEIEKAIVNRIGEHPQKFREGCHKAILKLPLEIATLLTLKPSLISPVVSTFCNLDALEAKHCKDIRFEDCINAEVTFTKYLYAMLTQFQLPKCNKYHVSRLEKKTQLGLKVTCGFQIIMSRLSKNICCTPEYKKFLKNLTENGYFRNNLEGSLQYTQLLDKAKAYYFDTECSISLQTCNTVNELKLCNEYIKTEELLKQKSDQAVLEEDDDNWLNVNSDQLNEFLNSRYGKNIKLQNSDPITPHILTSELGDFLKETSDFKGIEQKENREPDPIDFNSEDFVNCLKKMLNLISRSKNDQSDYISDDSDFDNYDGQNIDLTLNNQDLELASKLKSDENDTVEVRVKKNLSQSIKEEGIIGPASTILREIGLKKSDILDSDDDED